MPSATRLSESVISRIKFLVTTKMQHGNIFGKIVIFVLWFCVLHQCDVSAETILGDPYAILDVDRKASSQDIRRAYKKLAKEWCVCFSTPSMQ